MSDPVLNPATAISGDDQNIANQGSTAEPAGTFGPTPPSSPPGGAAVDPLAALEELLNQSKQAAGAKPPREAGANPAAESEPAEPEISDAQKLAEIEQQNQGKREADQVAIRQELAQIAQEKATAPQETARQADRQQQTSAQQTNHQLEETFQIRQLTHLKR